MTARPIVALLLGTLAACGSKPATRVSFTAVATSPRHPADVVVDQPDPVAARTHVLDATSAREITPTWIGQGPWQTVAVHATDQSVEEALAAGRTFVRRGGALRLDARLGAGSRGAFMGGVAQTGAERALLVVRVDDPDTLNARFVLRVHAIEAGRHRDATPAYLQRPLPRGTYRVWIDVPPRGGRYLVEVRTVDREGTVRGRAWSSPIAVERPWL